MSDSGRPPRIAERRAEDGRDAFGLRATAFGFGGSWQESEAASMQRVRDPLVHPWGAWVDDTLAGTADELEQTHLFGGREVPGAGVAGVTVCPESRGRGIAGSMMRSLLRSARERGAAVSALYRTVPGVYRRLGWEDCGALLTRRYPTAALATPQPPGLRVQRATESDVADIQSCYRQAIEASDAALVRPLGTDPTGFLAGTGGTGGTTLVRSGSRVIGYARWNRGTGYSHGSRLSVSELVAEEPSAARALIGTLASWGQAVPETAVRLPEHHCANVQFPVDGVVVAEERWMLRIIDVAGAVAARGWNPAVRGEVTVTVTDDIMAANSGSWTISFADGLGTVREAPAADCRLDIRGFARWYAGAAGLAELRASGLCSGGNPGIDAVLDAAVSGRRPALFDAF